MENSTTKTFPLLDVLSVTSGRVLTENGLGGIAKVLQYLVSSKNAPFTHQLVGIADKCSAALFEKYPILVEATAVFDHTTRENVDVLCAQTVAKYGDTITISIESILRHSRKS